MNAPASADQQVEFADSYADKLRHCSREFHRLAMSYEQQACAEASKLISQLARELSNARRDKRHGSGTWL